MGKGCEIMELRACKVNGIKAYFHRWVDKTKIVDPSPMVGGHSGGVIKQTIGIIEYESGEIHECYPHEIIFTGREGE